jgi:tetratricopeptide (TPR) repeat protein
MVEEPKTLKRSIFSNSPAKIKRNALNSMEIANNLVANSKYDEAISYLEKFKSDDMVLSALAIGAIGDAHSQKSQPKEALEFYVKASESNKNEFTTPRFLLKAGQTALGLNNKADALKYFTEIKEKYEATPEAANIDALIGLSQ